MEKTKKTPEEDVEAILTSEMAEAEREGEEYADCE